MQTDSLLSVQFISRLLLSLCKGFRGTRSLSE